MLSVGLEREATTLVTDADSAKRVSALVPDVYASTRLIGFVEAVATELLAEHLPARETSVGTGFSLRHEAPTPIGMKVRVRVRLVEVDGRRHVFECEAHDEIECILRGTHERAVIDRERFSRRVEEKRARGRGS
jgi:fluoroacetyl-CoA thioesterase